jgi:hypothetical protein
VADDDAGSLDLASPEFRNRAAWEWEQRLGWLQ